MVDGPHEERFLQLSVSRSVAEAPSLEAGLQAALEDVCEWTDWVLGQAWTPTAGGDTEPVPVSYVESEQFANFRDVSREFSFAPGEGIPGRVVASGEPVWFPDVSAVSEAVYPRSAHAAAVGLQAGLGVPVVADGEVVVVLEFYLAERREVDEQLVEAVSSVAGELGALVARKQAEDTLDRERELLEQMMEAAPVGISVFTRDGDLERANSRALELHDFSADETDRLAVTDRTLYDEAGDPVANAERPFTRVRETGDSVHDWVGQTDPAGGDRRWLSVDAAPILNDEGVPERVVISEEDITQLKEQARRLERQRDDLRSELDEVFARIDDAFFALDTNWRFAYVNERAEELLEHSREELHGERFWELFPNADDEDVRERFYDAIERQEPTRYERYSETLGFWVEASIYPSETGVSVTFRDVTERKERERQLEQHRALTEAANDVVVTIDTHSTIQTVNSAVTDVLGYDPDELIGDSLTVLMPDEFAERHHEGITRYLETGERKLDWNYVELTGQHADGSDVPLAVSFGEVEFEDERFFTGIIRDVSERKEREAELELFRRLIDHSHDAVFVIDPETGRFLDVNDTACRHLGYDRAELLEMTVIDVETNLSDWESWQTHVEDLRTEGSLTFEGKHRRCDGTTVPVEVSISDVELDREYMLAVARDVTERREYQRQLEASNERLEQFAYAASHDLQEPLRMVSSYLTLVENRYGDELDEDAEEFIEFAIDGAERMREMIDGLLQYSRIETRGDPFQPVDLDDLLDDVLANLEVKIEETDAEITAEDLPRVEGDASQLRQLFQNLLSNAIEYSGDEPPRIHVSVDRTGQEWTVSVRDEGIGIDPEDADRVFEVFQRLHSHDEHPGSGIGLALSRRIVERHDGDIWVESEPGEGSTFSFTLPAVDGVDE